MSVLSKIKYIIAIYLTTDKVWNILDTKIICLKNYMYVKLIVIFEYNVKHCSQSNYNLYCRLS